MILQLLQTPKCNKLKSDVLVFLFLFCVFRLIRIVRDQLKKCKTSSNAANDAGSSGSYKLSGGNFNTTSASFDAVKIHN